MSKRTSHAKCLLVVLLFVQWMPIAAGEAFGNIIYVDAVATGTKDGTSWANAYVYLQDTLVCLSSVDGTTVKQRF